METFYIFFVSKVFLVYICGMNEELKTILQKVQSLYRKYGIRSVTMDDIAHELGISKKTLYQYVRDKDDLVNQVVDLEIQERKSRMEISCADNHNAIEQLFEIGRCISYMLKDYSPASEYDLKKYYPDLYIKVRDLRRNHIMHFIQSNLIKGKEEGLYRENLNVDIISRLSVANIDSMIDSEVVSITEFLEPRFFHEYFVYHISGISNNKGLEVLEHVLPTYAIST
jgi:TetR/AcrR family transcriptional regulator, cholesterol catabolism regulator